MGRWEPDAQGRLRRAAMELFDEQGFDQTTVAGIAERAGVTERTFFRHFADKREVLFQGSAVLQELMVAAVDDAPPGSPIDAVAASAQAAATMLGDHRELSRARMTLIVANPELAERELVKMSRIALALGVALRERGVPEPAASLAAEAGIAAFRVGFDRWVADEETRSLTDVMTEAYAELKAVLAG